MRRILAIVAALLGAALPVSAATVRYRTDAELVAISNRVVRGRVLDSVVERAPSGAIRTRTRVAVIEDFTGGADAILTVLERGGRLPDGTAVWIPGAPQFAPGDDVVLCLERIADGYRTVSMAFSAFRVGAAVAGDRPLTRFGGITVVGGGATAAVEAAPGLGEFRRAAASITGVTSRVVATEAQAADAVASAAGARVDAPYTLLGGGIRWQQADSQQTIVWYRNTLRPSPIQAADTDDQLRTALFAWTDPAPASIILAFGGTRLIAIDDTTPGQDPYCTDGNLGAGLVTFGDPLDELPVGVLAIGGGCTSASTHVINGQAFRAFTHGLVVLNDDAALEGYRTVPNITRILEHEIGHGIGLGHPCEFGTCTQADEISIMYPACCLSATPIPPAIGPDDLAGLVFIYPLEAVTCTYTLSPTSGTAPVMGGEGSFTVSPSRASCPWTATASASWLIVLEGASGTGAGVVRYVVRPQLGALAPRTGAVSVGGQSFSVSQAGDSDHDGDRLPTGWEYFFGLDGLSSTGANGADGDPDGDGLTNAQELAAGSHPRGTFVRYLAEGAVNAFFDARISVFNPRTTQAAVLLRIQPESGIEQAWPVTLSAFKREAFTTPILRSLSGGGFSTVIESDRPIVVDRTMRWDARGYGAHAEVAIEAPATTWYLAEGSTSGDFALFYLLQNPGPTSVQATVRFLRPQPQPPIDRVYTIAAHARLTIPVDSLGPELESTDVSGVVTATQPIIVERAMYLNLPGQPFGAGHGSAGVTAPALDWFMAEGATGSFFDLFILLENPGSQAAQVQVDYLLANGTTLSKQYAVAPQSRFTIYVDAEQLPGGSGQRPLADVSVGARVRSLNGVPIVVERSMWWPDGRWYEAHNTPAATVTGTEWAFADGYAGGPDSAETYVLIANPSDLYALAQVDVVLDGTIRAQQFGVPPHGRVTLPIGAFFPQSVGQRFAIRVISSTEVPVPIVVERAMYDSPQGQLWSAGTAALGVRLTP
jgi:hypothetical protein